MHQRDRLRTELLAFLATIARPGRPVDGVADDLHLFDEGILDSLAVIQIIMHLEQQHGVDLGGLGVDPTELATVAGILNTIERAGA